MGCRFGYLCDIIFEKVVLWTTLFQHMFSASILEAFLIGFGSSREPPEQENPLEFMQLSSKIKFRRICGHGGFEVTAESIFDGF